MKIDFHRKVYLRMAINAITSQCQLSMWDSTIRQSLTSYKISLIYEKLGKENKKNHRILIRLHHINSHARTHNKITAFSIDSSPKAFELQFFFDAIIAVENALCCWRAQLSSAYKYMYTSELQCNVNISTNFLSAEFRNVRARADAFVQFCSAKRLWATKHSVSILIAQK